MHSIGIIGAGLSGLVCAKKLASAGLDVTIVEKSRGVSGRMATRRASDAVFDHGAQYFTVSSDAFRTQVESWIAAGVAAEWNGRIVSLQNGVMSKLDGETKRFVGVPTMTAIGKSLAAELNVRSGFRAQSLRRHERRWRLIDETGNEVGPFDFVVSSAPPVQTRELFGANSAVLVTELSTVELAPCWATMVRFEQPLDAPFDAAFVNDSPLRWIAHNASKPERTDDPCWVLHAAPDWSREHLEEPSDSIAPQMLDHFWRETGLRPQPVDLLQAHRWRYSLPEKSLPKKFAIDREARLAACGDWCDGPKVEGAWFSGTALADALLAEF